MVRIGKGGYLNVPYDISLIHLSNLHGHMTNMDFLSTKSVQCVL